MRKSNRFHPRHHRGVTLLEVTVVTLIAVIVATGLFGLATWHFSGMAADAVAQHALVAGRAAAAYTTANAAALSAAAGPTTPAVVPMNTLTAGGYLPAGFNAVNNEGQTLELRVIEPAPGELLAIVVGTGGQTMDDGRARRVANLVGAAGGAILSTAPTVITGSYGGWTVALASLGGSPGVGRVAVNATLIGLAQQ